MVSLLDPPQRLLAAFFSLCNLTAKRPVCRQSTWARALPPNVSKVAASADLAARRNVTDLVGSGARRLEGAVERQLPVERARAAGEEMVRLLDQLHLARSPPFPEGWKVPARAIFAFGMFVADVKRAYRHNPSGERSWADFDARLLPVASLCNLEANMERWSLLMHQSSPTLARDIDSLRRAGLTEPELQQLFTGAPPPTSGVPPDGLFVNGFNMTALRSLELQFYPRKGMPTLRGNWLNSVRRIYAADYESIRRAEVETTMCLGPRGAIERCFDTRPRTSSHLRHRRAAREIAGDTRSSTSEVGRGPGCKPGAARRAAITFAFDLFPRALRLIYEQACPQLWNDSGMHAAPRR